MGSEESEFDSESIFSDNSVIELELESLSELSELLQSHPSDQPAKTDGQKNEKNSNLYFSNCLILRKKFRMETLRQG